MTAKIYLTLDSFETEFLFIGLVQKLAHSSSLCSTDSTRNIGFIFDEHLTFFDQILAPSILQLSYSWNLLYLSLHWFEYSHCHLHCSLTVDFWLLFQILK